MQSFRKNIQELSKLHPKKVFLVSCTNYADSKSYYLKNGLFATNTGFNIPYQFTQNKCKLTALKKDGIYKAVEIELTENNKRIYNL